MKYLRVCFCFLH